MLIAAHWGLFGPGCNRAKGLMKSRRALKSKTRALGCSQRIFCLIWDLRKGWAEISVPSSAPETFRVEQIQKWDPWIVILCGH